MRPARAEGSAPQSPPPLEGRRILIVLGNLDLGGAERQALILARHLADRQKAHVEVWGLGPVGRAAEHCDRAGIPWRSWPVRWTGGRTARIVSLLRFAIRLRKAAPEVLLPYTTIPNVACGVAARFSGARLCAWNQRDEGLSHPVATLERRAASRTRVFVANSPGSASFLTRALGVDPALVRVIPNGVELAPAREDRASWRERIGVGDATFLACMIANLHDNKDHETLLRAWRIALDRDPLSRGGILLLAGSPGNIADRLASLHRALQLGDSVRFMGAVDDVAGLLGAVDLGLLTSRSEGCPNGVLECMAAGLPVGGTDIPGIRGALGMEGSALLAPPGDAEALAAKIALAAGDPALRATLGETNRRRAGSEFSPDRMCEAMTRLIVEEMETAQGGGRTPRGDSA